MSKILTEDEWTKTYVPVPNHIDSGHGYNGNLFETYGPELIHVQKTRDTAPDKIWTLLDVDGVQIIVPGYHQVNRMGYFITRNPFYSFEIEVQLDDPEEDI